LFCAIYFIIVAAHAPLSFSETVLWEVKEKKGAGVFFSGS